MGYSVKPAVHLEEQAWSQDFTIVRRTVYEKLMLSYFLNLRLVPTEYHVYQ